MKTFDEFFKETDGELYKEAKKKKWIQKAVNPDHKGFCTPETKKTCTPARKALAERFKKGDIHKDNEKKSKKKAKKKE
jgi:hypothetical protein